MKHAKAVKDYDLLAFSGFAGPNHAMKVFSAKNKKTKAPASVLIFDKSSLEKDLNPSTYQKLQDSLKPFTPSKVRIETSNALIYVLDDEILCSLSFLPESYCSEDAILFGLSSLNTKEFVRQDSILVRYDGTYI